MKKIRLDGIEVLAGLEWTALPQDVSEKKAMRDFLSNNKGARRGVKIHARGVTVVGTQPLAIADSSGKAPSWRDQLGLNTGGKNKGKGAKGDAAKTSGVPSASALLALANQRVMEATGGLSTEAPTVEENNWIVAQALDAGPGSTNDAGEELFWLGVVQNGVPIPGGDIVAPRQQVIEEILEILTTSHSFVVHTTDKDIRYNVVGHIQVVEKNFQELVRGLPTKKAEMVLFSLGMYMVVGLVVLLVVLGGGWWWYSSWTQDQAIKAAAARAAAQGAQHSRDVAKASAEYEKDVRAAVDKGLKDLMDGVTQSLDAPSPRDVIAAWHDLLYNVDLDQSGWQLTEVDCALDNSQPTCTINLDRHVFGVNRILLAAHPDAVINGDKAAYTVRGQELPGRSTHLTALVSPVDMQVGLLSDLETLRNVDIEHEAKASADKNATVTLPPRPAVLPALTGTSPTPGKSAPSITIQSGVASGDLTVKSSGLWKISGLEDILDQPTIVPKTLIVKIPSQDVTKTDWAMEFDYYLRSLPRPIVPPVVLDATHQIVVPVPPEYTLDPAAPTTPVAPAPGGVAPGGTAPAVKPGTAPSGAPAAITAPAHH